jgi:hypothetical protein
MAIRRDIHIVTSATVTPAEADSASTSPDLRAHFVELAIGREPGRRFELQSPMRLRFATISRSTDVARQVSRGGFLSAGAKSPAFERYFGRGATEYIHQLVQSHH